MKMERFEVANRGFHGYRFRDLYDEECSIQQSSLATDEAIWLGLQRGTHVYGECLARMHLNRDQVRALLPMLQRFADTGELTHPADEPARSE